MLIPNAKSNRPKPVRVQSTTKPLVVDGWEFNTPLDAALHLMWLLQRLSYYEKHREGQPCVGIGYHS